MKDLKTNVSKKIYQEELIRIDFSLSSKENKKERIEEFANSLVEKGYNQYTQKVYTIKYTLLENKNNVNDDYFKNNRNDKIKVFKNSNHCIYLTKNSIIITNNDTNKLLKGYNEILELIRDKLFCYADDKIYDVRYEAETQDYIRKINEVEAYYNDLRVDTQLKEIYNKVRTKSGYLDKGRTEEHYSCEYKSDYFNENNICYSKVVNFSTAEYYNDCIGRIIIDIATNYFNSNVKVNSNNLIEVVNDLRKKQYDVLISCFTQEYKEKLF